MTRTFTCAYCDDACETEGSPEEADQEMVDLTGPLYFGEQKMALCDGCYESFLKWFHSLTDWQKAAIERYRINALGIKPA